MEDMLNALELLRDCSSADSEGSGQMQETRPDGQLLTTPSLQLRCNALEATAKLLIGLLASELYTQIYVSDTLCALTQKQSLLCWGCRRHSPSWKKC